MWRKIRVDTCAWWRDDRSENLTRRAGFTISEVLVSVSILSLLAAIAMPRFWLAVDSGKLSACRQNLQNVATALQVYANGHDGQFCQELKTLVPDHLKALPTCPAAGRDTFSPGYQLSKDGTTYTLLCRGRNHGPVGMQANEPWYVFGRGAGP